MNIWKQTEITQRFNDVLKIERIKNKPVVVKVSIVELIEICDDNGNKRNKKYSILRKEWLNNI